MPPLTLCYDSDLLYAPIILLGQNSKEETSSSASMVVNCHT